MLSVSSFITWVDVFKKLEEAVHVNLRPPSEDSTFNLFLISFQIFFPKFKLPNSGCSLSASVRWCLQYFFSCLAMDLCLVLVG